MKYFKYLKPELMKYLKYPKTELMKYLKYLKTELMKYKTSKKLRMLSSVTINCQITKIVMNSGSQLSEL